MVLLVLSVLYYKTVETLCKSSLKIDDLGNATDHKRYYPDGCGSIMNHTIQGNMPRNKAVFAVFWETLGQKKICKEWELKKGHGVVYLTGA